VILGDSTVFGWGVDDGGTVADGLADALAESHPEVGPVEVINAGQPGYSTYQAAWLMETVLAAWEPDLTVLFVPLHDANLVLVSDREQHLGAASPGAAVRILLARHSRLYQVLRQALYTQSANPSVVPQHATDGEPRVPRVSDAERSEAIARVAELASTWGGHLGVGLLPFQGDLVRREPTDRPSAGWASTETSAQGLLLLDARACCGPHGGHLVLADDPGHLTAEGNRLVGASMAPEVAAALTGRP
jgi:lysophospholipase L1-like esterase